MTEIQLDFIQTAGVGALALVLGTWLTGKLSFLKRFCVPSPVSGGIIFSLLTLVVYLITDVQISFDGTLKDVAMLVFFTSVGFQSNMKVLKQGGKLLLLMLVLLVMIITIQNSMSLAITKLMGVNPLVGMAAGSISMTGGHGTAGGFSAVLESMGLDGAATVSMAAATFGLIAGSVIGGPMAERLIRKNLSGMQTESMQMPSDNSSSFADSLTENEVAETNNSKEEEYKQYTKATYCLALVMAGGTLISMLLQKTGITFPTYFGSLILAAIVRNVAGAMGKDNCDGWFDMNRIVSLGNISLGMFLGMAMISLKLWELQSLALPLVVILFAQIVLMILFVYFIAFRLLGKDYDAAVLVAGICGFGLGATPNAMANMNAVCNKYGYTVKPFLIVPIIGAMFTDIINTGIITMFLNWIGK